VKKTVLSLLLAAACPAVVLAAPAPAAKPAAAPAPAPATAAGAAPAAKPTGDPVVVTAGTVTIRQSELDKALASLPEQYQAAAMGAGKKAFAEEYLQMKLLAVQGMAAGLDKTPEVMAQLAMVKENVVAQAELNRMAEAIQLSDDDLRKIYDSKKADYESVKAKHILIAFKGSPAARPGKPELTEEQAKAKAEALRKKIVDGASFEEVAKAESDDTQSGASGGELGEFSRGQMVPEFEQAAFAAKAGEVTPIVRSQYGYHVIKVESHGTTPFEQVKPVLERNERQARLQAQLSKIKDAAKPTFDPSYFTEPDPHAGMQQQPQHP
jgi:peptidyl-prolyl cis-trans isomerase C